MCWCILHDVSTMHCQRWTLGPDTYGPVKSSKGKTALQIECLCCEHRLSRQLGTKSEAMNTLQHSQG